MQLMGLPKSKGKMENVANKSKRRRLLIKLTTSDAKKKEKKRKMQGYRYTAVATNKSKGRHLLESAKAGSLSVMEELLSDDAPVNFRGQVLKSASFQKIFLGLFRWSFSTRPGPPRTPPQKKKKKKKKKRQEIHALA